MLVLLSILKNAVFSSNSLFCSEMFLRLASHFSFNFSFVFSKRICLLCLCFRRYFAVYRDVNEIVLLVCFLQVFHCGVFFCVSSGFAAICHVCCVFCKVFCVVRVLVSLTRSIGVCERFLVCFVYCIALRREGERRGGGGGGGGAWLH